MTCDASGALTCTAGRVIINKVCVIRITSCPLTPAAYLDPVGAYIQVVEPRCGRRADANPCLSQRLRSLRRQERLDLLSHRTPQLRSGFHLDRRSLRGSSHCLRGTVLPRRPRYVPPPFSRHAFAYDSLPANRCVGCTDVNALACSASAASSCAAGFMLVGGACEVPLTGCAEQFYLDGNCTSSSLPPRLPRLRSCSSKPLPRMRRRQRPQLLRLGRLELRTRIRDRWRSLPSPSDWLHRDFLPRCHRCVLVPSPSMTFAYGSLYSKPLYWLHRRERSRMLQHGGVALHGRVRTRRRNLRSPSHFLHRTCLPRHYR